MFVNYNKFTRQYTTCVYIRSIWLKTLIITQYLRGTCRWHRSHQQRVSYTMFFNFFAQFCPIPTSTQFFILNSPKIMLKLAIANGRPLITLVRPILLGLFHTCCNSSKVKRFKYVLIEFFCFVTGKRHAQLDKSICQTLNPQTYWSMTEIGIFGFFNWIIVSIYNLVQVFGNAFGNFK